MKFLLICLCFLSTSVLAEISTEQDNSKSVSDLMYLPESGTWYFGTGSRTINNESKVEYQNKLFYTSEDESSSTGFEIGTVVDKNFLVSISIPYLIKGKNSLTYGPASTKDGQTVNSESDGFGDIGASFKWRVKSQDGDNFNMDINFNFSPETGKAENASATKDGNNYRGGTDYSAGIEIGKKLKNVQFSGGVNLEFNGSRTTKDLSDDSKTKISSYSQFSLNGSIQLMPTENFFFRGNLSMFGSADFESTSEGSKTEYSIDPFFQLGIGAGYQLSKSFLLRFTYTTAKLERSIKSGSNNFDNELDIRAIQTEALIQF